VERLYRGIHKFQSSHFKKEEEFFRRLSTRQTPEVLFITCSDSRVDPSLVTQSKPGELFIVRNVGNIIPPYESIKDKNSFAAALEFAVLELKVADIIVCGHSNCGAMKSLYQNVHELQSMPHLREWITLATPAKRHVEQYYPDVPQAKKERITEKENILEQLRNIETYPFVANALEEGTVYLHGWYYDIGKGEILSYNPIADKFEHKLPLKADSG
jgi:carbonic anhydrase